ncbi:MAG: phosphoglucomutase, partial [Desulfuromonas sp.]
QEKGVAPSEEELGQALDQLSRIVVTLGADAGFWLGPSGEKVKMVGAGGRIFSDLEALSIMTNLAATADKSGSVVVPMAAPGVIDALADANGMTVKRTRSDGRSLVEAGHDRQVRLVGSLDGRFGFPSFQSNVDGLYTIAKSMELCVSTGLSLDDAFQEIPKRSYHHLQLPCSWEYKGGLMRRMSEDAVDKDASFVDGVRINDGQSWVLVLPDPYRPLAHLYCESPDQATAEKLKNSYYKKITAWLHEMAKSNEG